MCILCENDIGLEEAWSDICGSSWEFMSWWYFYDYEGGDWDQPCTLWVGIADPDSEHWDEEGVITATFTFEDMVRALEELRDHPVIMDCLRGGDFDAIYGSVVIQQAIFGEVIYG